MVVEKVISRPQDAFVKGRQKLDAVLIANECLDNRLKLGEPGLLCKLDMEKAYNRVNWSFLLYMLERFGFGMKWCSWIKHFISTLGYGSYPFIEGSPSMLQSHFRFEGELGQIRGSSGGHVHNVDSMTTILGCKISHLPMKYLGLPLGAHYKSISIWNDVLEKMERKLASWKQMYLSKGGRVTLIKVPSPTY
ncbi:uncharacterized protein LOC122302626 [Carya illinoinensis]|uniref:uncharacterized protein LOC122302626 n=1 Tax=Carya illinoinensis TaxID=32201 RepID=UPI001C721E23|nr:uncharacterized protein LOC122302626 [Carya illinoinensis]